MWMKNVGIAILAIGVGITAALGARLSPSMHEQVTTRGSAQFLGAAEQTALEAYCAARTAAELPDADGCGEAASAPAAGGSDAVRRLCEGRRGAADADEVARGERERLAGLRAADTSALPSEVRARRDAWLDALEARIEPAARAAALRPVQPATRLREWLSANGVGFVLGLVLVIAGAVVGRIGIKRAALGAAPGAKDRAEAPGASDLGKALEELHDAMAALAAEARAIEKPSPADYDRIKSAVHEIVLTRFEPIVDARLRVQARYGMGGFAEIYGPFARAERSANRAWSALVDSHFPEACDALAQSAESLAATREILGRLAA